MMQVKKYRERYGPNTIFVASVMGNRIHDTLKGWGTISKTGKTILWDSWVRPKRNSKRDAKAEQHSFDKFIVPPIKKVFPALILKDIMSVQPLSREKY